MKSFFFHILLSIVFFMVVPKLNVGIEVDTIIAAILAALVFGALNATVKPVLKILTLPITLLTLGLFLFVLNAGMFGLAAFLVPGFRVNGFMAALIGSLAFSVFGWVIGKFID